MRRMAWLLALPALALVATAAAPHPAHVMGVVDAAHLDVARGGLAERVALIGVDASTGGPCGTQGAAYLRSLVLGKDANYYLRDTTKAPKVGM